MQDARPEATALGAVPAQADVIEFDISAIAQRLAWLRFAEIFLMYVGLVFFPAFLIYGLLGGGLSLPILLMYCLMIAFGVVAYRDSGKLRPRVWRQYRFIMPAALLLQLLFVFFVVAYMARVGDKDAAPLIQVVFRLLISSVVSVVGAVIAFRLLQSRIEPTHRKAVDAIEAIEHERLKQPSARKLAQPINRTRGIACVLGAAAVTFVSKGWLDYIPLVWDGLAIFLLFRSRQYFQLSAESLLHEDTRPPILFLRSFADDPSVRSWFSGVASADEMAGPSSVRRRAGFQQLMLGPLGRTIVGLVDYSIEMRLANHFMDFGPFIAVGSPKDTVPQIGAARVHLADSEWQSKVAGWIETSSTLVVMAGTTKWIEWELARIIERDQPPKTILLWPRPLATGKRKPQEIEAAMKSDLAARLDNVQRAFANSRWAPALAKLTALEHLLAMRFHPSGAITVFKSERRNNDAYQLAVELLHMEAAG